MKIARLKQVFPILSSSMDQHNQHHTALTIAAKRHAAIAVAARDKTGAEAARELGTCRQYIFRYAKRHAEGLALHERAGRPRSIDLISFVRLICFIQEHPGIWSTDLRAEIAKEAEESWRRSHRLAPPDHPIPRISAKTLYRYEAFLRLEAIDAFAGNQDLQPEL